MTNEITIGELNKTYIINQIKQGDLFKNESSTYIVSRVQVGNKSYYSLINLDEGNNWSDITTEIEEVFGNSKEQFTKVDYPITITPYKE